ncbi:ComEC/Rec2 family competence protein [Candidatus Nitrososphaera sp. FF02]|uniref:ComEC/Rec2 family competence protein n=1 Tax=Candidatus Nitrososphaera sp. FF02 TaxID=3398226 RepID=UPI0039ED88DA
MRTRLLALLILLALCPATAQAQEGTLKIVFIDVGQGDSTLVIMPNGRAMLVDGGPRDQSQAVLSAMQEHGVSELDVVVATHPHADHIGGLIGVIYNMPVERVIDSGQRHITQTFGDYEQAAEARGIPIEAVREGQTINLDPSVSVLVLNPDDTVPVGAHDEDDFNNNSVAIRLDYGEFSAMLPGDIEKETEGKIAMEKDLDVDVVLASHHGSGGSNTSVYLQDATPEVVVIYAGAGNPYGHPHPDALQRLDANSQHIFRTDLDGTIVLESDGSSEYTMSAAGRTVVVPEFENAAVVAGLSLLAALVLVDRKLSGLA